MNRLKHFGDERGSAELLYVLLVALLVVVAAAAVGGATRAADGGDLLTNMQTIGRVLNRAATDAAR